jgi:hypothetical protein
VSSAAEATTEGPSRRDVVVAAVYGVVLALLMTGPLVLHLGSDIAQDVADPLLQSWQVAWIGHALLHHPAELWNANTFWPLEDSLAFTDALVGYAPAAIFAQGSPHAALVVYNLLFLGTYALAFFGAYLLARELGIGWLGAVVTGVAFAYAPWRLAQNGHLHVLSSGGIPLALFLLIRGYRRQRARLVAGGWLVAAWQMTLGFTLGLQLAYLLGVLAVVAVVAVGRGRLPRPGREVTAATVLGAAVFVTATAFMAVPYLRVARDHPEARRDAAFVADYSPEPRSLVAAPRQSWLWGDGVLAAPDRFAKPDEMSLFPGLTILVLALVGLLASVLPFGLRAGLGAGVVVCAVLSLGLDHVSEGERDFSPYRILYHLAPGWDGVRATGRINTLTSLGLALLAGAGACAIVRALARRDLGVVATVCAGVLVAAILLEGYGPVPHAVVPAPAASAQGAGDPQLSLPTDYLHDILYGYWSIGDFPSMVNGVGAFDPDEQVRIREAVRGFPDERSIRVLRAVGVRTVLVHLAQAPGTPWENAADKPIRGLALARVRIGDVVLFRLGTRS